MRNFEFKISALALLISCVGAHAQDCTVKIPKETTGRAQGLALEATRSNPCTTVPGLTAKSLTSVWGALLHKTKTGGSREAAVPPAGIPRGKVMPTAQGVPFDLLDVRKDGVEDFRITAGGDVVFSTSNPENSSFVLPLSQLKPGIRYEWNLKTGKSNYRASFEVLNADQRAAVQAQMDAVEKAQLSPQVRLLYTAAVYDEARMYQERDRTLGQLQAQLAP